MHSIRFNCPVILTRHAVKRMGERNITQDELLAVIDTGGTRFKDATHLWAYKHLDGRSDNLICAVLVPCCKGIKTKGIKTNRYG